MNSLTGIITIFDQIKETSSKTGKEAILKKNEANVLFRTVLEFLYDPFVLTGIKDKKLKKYEAFRDDKYHVNIEDIIDAMNYIDAHNSGRDEDIKVIANFINSHDDVDVQKFLKELFTKEYKCGITASTINKVYGKNTIPEFDVLLAKSYKDHGHKIIGEFYVTLKLDGIRCVAIKQNGVVKFFTRQGQPIDGLVDIELELERYPDNTVYDGELLLINDNKLSSDDLFRATQKVVRKDGVKKNLSFHLFDVIPLEEFLEGKSKKKYTERRSDLNMLLANIEQFYIRTLPVLYKGNDKSVIPDLLEQVIADGYEGLMINITTGYYVTKRSDVLLKVKRMYTIDLMIVGFEVGTGKYEGMLGSLIVDYKGYRVGVGSGFTDQDRRDLWEMGIKGELDGRVCEVQYFEESNNQDGGISLRFPVFKMLREEGKEVSYN